MTRVTVQGRTHTTSPPTTTIALHTWIKMSDRTVQNTDAKGPKARQLAASLRGRCLAAAGLVVLVFCWSRGNFNWMLPPRNSGETTSPLKRNSGAIGFRQTDEGLNALDLVGGDEKGGGSGGGSAKVELERPGQFGGAVALKSERIVFCPIEKVACTEWLKVFRWVDGQEDWEQPKHHKHGLDVLGQMGVERANGILNSPDWLKIAIVREPAERLLSCYLQKCNKWNMQNEYPNCPYLDLWPELFVGERYPNGRPREPNEGTHSDIVAAFNALGARGMFIVYVDSITRKVKANSCKENGHWSPQYCHCSLDITAPAFRIVGWDSMTDGAAAAIVPAASTPQRGEEIGEFLDRRMGKNHERPGKKTAARDSASEWFSDDMLKTVREAYAKDYELFSQYWE